MDTFALFTAKAWITAGVKVIEYVGKQGYLQEKLDLLNVYDKNQYYPDKCKKMKQNTREW